LSRPSTSFFALKASRGCPAQAGHDESNNSRSAAI
jgi:hypothetical protein